MGGRIERRPPSLNRSFYGKMAFRIGVGVSATIAKVFLVLFV
jgi:hypothetical protein